MFLINKFAKRKLFTDGLKLYNTSVRSLEDCLIFNLDFETFTYSKNDFA